MGGEQTGGFVAGALKLGGMVVALNEVLTQPTIRPGALALSSLLLTGGQALSLAFQYLFGERR